MLVEFLTSLLSGVDLVRFDFLVPLLAAFIIIVSCGLLFRTMLALFDVFFTGRR